MFVSSCQNVIAKIENLNQDTSDRLLSILIGVRGGEGRIFVRKTDLRRKEVMVYKQVALGIVWIKRSSKKGKSLLSEAETSLRSAHIRVEL